MTASSIDMWLMGVTWQTMGILVCAPNHFIVLNRIAHSISFFLLCDSTSLIKLIIPFTLVHAFSSLLLLTGIIPTVFSTDTNNECQAASLKMSSAVDVDTKTALLIAANEARGLAMDSIAAAHSGHMGLPLGCAEVGASLYGSQVRFPLPTS